MNDYFELLWIRMAEYKKVIGEMDKIIREQEDEIDRLEEIEQDYHDQHKYFGHEIGMDIR